LSLLLFIIDVVLATIVDVWCGFCVCVCVGALLADALLNPCRGISAMGVCDAFVGLLHFL
jgi:hypothetical protein